MTPTDTTTGLHLTINDRDRQISLWDTEDSARCQRSERYVCLPLSSEQRALLSFSQDDTGASPIGDGRWRGVPSGAIYTRDDVITMFGPIDESGDPYLTRRDMEETYRNDTGD